MQIVRNYSKSLVAYGCMRVGSLQRSLTGDPSPCVCTSPECITSRLPSSRSSPGPASTRLLSRRFGFQSRGRTFLQEVGLVYAASSLGFGVSTLTLMACVEWVGLPALAGKVIGSAAAFLLNFGARQFFVFSAEPRWK